MKKVVYKNRVLFLTLIVYFSIILAMNLSALFSSDGFRLGPVIGIMLSAIVLFGIVKRYFFVVPLIHTLNIVGLFAICFQLISRPRLLQNLNLAAMLLILLGFGFISMSLAIMATVKKEKPNATNA